MGLILIQTKDEVDNLTAEAMASLAEELLQDEYTATRWLWSADDEERVIRLMDKLISELEG